MAQKRPSKAVTEGTHRAPNRAMLRAVGFEDADFVKPIIGLSNAHSNLAPCNVGLNPLVLRADAALRRAGAKALTFGTITVADGIAMGTEGMKYSLVSREVIADSIETVCAGQSMDGVVAFGGCDKNMPGSLIAMARLNIPPSQLMELCGVSRATLWRWCHRKLPVPGYARVILRQQRVQAV